MSDKMGESNHDDVSRTAKTVTSTGLVSRLKEAIATALPIANEVNLPTYEQDRVGVVKPWDERDILFARKDFFRYFGSDSPEYKAYYEAHPEFLEYDTKMGNAPGLGRTGGVDVPMFEAQFEAIKKIGSESFVDGAPAPHRAEIPSERVARKVKALARLLGADVVKIGLLRQEWVYSHVGRSVGNSEGYQRWGTPVDLCHHTSAVAMAFRMDYDLITSAPDFPTLLATAKGYAIGAWVSIQLAEYIRMLGYSARAHHLNNYRVLCVPVAVDCGLGELARAGFLITKEFGLGLRLAVVTTDMPVAHDRPVDIGAQSFCEFCRICAEDCPIGAIPMDDKVEYNGIRKWKLDEKKCYRYWHAVGTDCGICMTSCPWTKPRNWFHKSMSLLATTKGPHQSLMARADRLVYSKFESAPRPDFIDPIER
jgi:Pyruvate/2-oxoacid:ferredoxin oxidoreductase delta subunit